MARRGRIISRKNKVVTIYSTNGGCKDRERARIETEGKDKSAQSRGPDSFSLAHLSDLHLTSLNALKLLSITEQAHVGLLLVVAQKTAHPSSRDH